MRKAFHSHRWKIGKPEVLVILVLVRKKRDEKCFAKNDGGAPCGLTAAKIVLLSLEFVVVARDAP